ncbi:hypothetical protein MTsPCn5_04520 [Croceitalea sp. MTPC5]|nr:hypothetical protein MTsPCn5_04520 [Croceitalea sp. MTPC5]
MTGVRTKVNYDVQGHSELNNAIVFYGNVWTLHTLNGGFIGRLQSF